MAKLPDLDALGNGPSLRSGRGIVDADSFNLQAMPRAVQKVAAQVGKVAEEYEKDQDALDAIRADAEAKTGFMRLEQEIESNTTDHANYDSNWQAGSKGVLESAASKIRNPQLKEKFQLQGMVHAESARQRLLDKSRNLAKQDAVATLEGATRDHYSVFTDPNAPEHRRVQAQADARAGIKLGLDTGVLTRAQAQQLEDKYIRGGAWDRSQAAAAADPERLTEDLAKEREWRKQQNSSTAGKGASADGIFSAPGMNITNGIDPAAPYMSPKRQRDEGAIRRIIMHGDVNEDGDKLLKYGRQVDKVRGFDPGYHFYVNRDGTVVQGAPLNRTANHALNENADSIGIVIAGADAGKMPTAEQEAAAKRLVSSLGRTYNIDPKNVIGHGELQPGRRDHREGGNVAADIRKGGYLPEEESKLAGRSLTRVAGLHPASDVPPATARPYADLTPEQLETMYYRASKAGGLKLEGRRHDFKNKLANDIELRRTTGKGLSEEQLELANASKVLDDSQISNYKLGVVEADYEYNVRYGLDQMPSDQIREHLAHLAPKPTDEHFAIKNKVLNKVAREVNGSVHGVLAKRRKDPAAAVNNHPFVKQVMAELDAEIVADSPFGVAPSMDPARRERLVDARLAAQEQLGIPTWQRQPVSREEAMGHFADVPSYQQVGATEYLKNLKRISDEIEGTWGKKHANAIFKAGMKYALGHDSESKEIQSSVLARIVKGEPVPQSMIRGMNDMHEADLSGMAFGAVPLQYEIEGFDPSLAPDEPITPPAPVPAERPKGKPKPEHIEWLRKDPLKRKDQFIRDFGKEEALRALQGN